MRITAIWDFPAVLAATVFLLHCVSEVCNQEGIAEFQCPFNTDVYTNASDQLKPFKNCKAIITLGKIQVWCNAYASSALKLPLFTNTTAAVLVTDFMETYHDIDDILAQPSNSSCMRFISSRIQKLDFRESEILKDQNQHTCTIPKELFIPLMLIELMDVRILLNQDYDNGILYYNKTCLKLRYSADPNNSVDVSACISYAGIARRFLTTGKTFQLVANLSMEYFFVKDFLNIILLLVNEVLYTGYHFCIPYIAFRSSLIKYLPMEALTLLSQKNVSAVELMDSGILSIRNGDIPIMDSLQTLDLSNGQIENIEPNAFDGVVHLKELNLQGNKLKELSYAFHIFNNLEFLNLRGNGRGNTKGFQFVSHVIGPETGLRNLDLSDMVLLDFWENLGKLPKLKYLNIANCSLGYIPFSNLSHTTPGLVNLNLSANNLDSLNIKFLSRFVEIEALDLSHNRLTDIQYNAIIDVLPNLRSISLRANDIVEFLTLTLSDESALEHLDLSSNKIHSWKQAKINADENRLYLNLIGNNITEVNSYMVNDFNSVRHVQLSINPFDCKSCTMKNFLAWLTLKNSSTDFLTSPYKCSFPKEDFKKIITDVTLDLCLEDVFDWIDNALIPAIVVILLVSAAIAIFVYRWYVLYFVYLFRAKFQKYKRRDNRSIFNYDAFVSYCTSDRDWVVNHLIPAIEKHEPNLHLCVHERDFEIGETIMNNVVECIDNSHKSIFVLSRSFIQSQWCQWELQMAQHKLFEDKRDVLILVMLGELNEKETPKMLKRLISKRTYLQWPVHENGRRLFWKRLRDAIGKCQCVLYKVYNV